MDNNFENVEVKESQAAELESIKELFYAGEQRLVGIKDNVVSFSCDRCEEIGTINKEGETEGRETYDWISEGIKKILSENNFEDMEFSKKDWENYEKSLIEKTDEEQQKFIKEKIQKYNKNGAVYFANEESIIAESENKGKYKLLNLQQDILKGMLTGNPYETNVFSGQEDGIKGEKSDLFIPLFIYVEFRRRKKGEFKIIPDEIPEDVKNYLLNSSIFQGDEELYNDTIIGEEKNK